MAGAVVRGPCATVARDPALPHPPAGPLQAQGEAAVPDNLTLRKAVASLNACEPYHKWLFGLYRDLVECGRRMYMGKSAHLSNQHGPPDDIKVTRALRDLHPLPAADESEVEEAVTDADDAEDVPDPYDYQRNSECFYCHEIGHWAARCPHKPANIVCHFCDVKGHDVKHCGARVRQ
ncbi:MAG: hypothetical protein WDW38_000022 [Sanguina aurantia]